MLSKKFKPLILFIVCDANIGFLIQKHFLNTDFSIDITYDPDIGVHEALSNKYDLIMMDCHRKSQRCFELLYRIRMINHNIPIIILGKNDNGQNAMKTFHNGGNLFHFNPPNLPLLETEIKCLLSYKSKNVLIQMNDIEINLTSRLIKRDGHEITLTKSEFNFLFLLVKNNGKVITREKIISDVLNYNKDVEYAAVDTMVSRTRKKLSQYGQENVIDTVIKIGYRLNQLYANSCKIKHF